MATYRSQAEKTRELESIVSEQEQTIGELEEELEAFRAAAAAARDQLGQFIPDDDDADADTEADSEEIKVTSRVTR